DRVYQEALAHLCQSLKAGRDVAEVMIEIRRTFDQIPVEGVGERPLVGIVGEIYTRANRFANENVVTQLEELGAEVWMPPISEWILYVNHTGMASAWRRRALKNFLGLALTDHVQRKIEHRLAEPFKGAIRNLHEPTIRETLSRARPYIHHSFEGEAPLSVGKSADFVKHGASGLVNVMPFTCMPGTIVNAVLKRFREEHGNLPYLALACDGQEQTNTRVRLEAFMHQVKQRHARQTGRKD
ncbi:MAG: CoA activase, partial [Thermodesulfobacteriota bacterium]